MKNCNSLVVVALIFFYCIFFYLKGQDFKKATVGGKYFYKYIPIPFRNPDSIYYELKEFQNSFSSCTRIQILPEEVQANSVHFPWLFTFMFYPNSVNILDSSNSLIIKPYGCIIFPKNNYVNFSASNIPLIIKETLNYNMAIYHVK